MTTYRRIKNNDCVFFWRNQMQLVLFSDGNTTLHKIARWLLCCRYHDDGGAAIDGSGNDGCHDEAAGRSKGDPVSWSHIEPCEYYNTKRNRFRARPDCLLVCLPPPPSTHRLCYQNSGEVPPLPIVPGAAGSTALCRTAITFLVIVIISYSSKTTLIPFLRCIDQHRWPSVLQKKVEEPLLLPVQLT